MHLLSKLALFFALLAPSLATALSLPAATVPYVIDEDFHGSAALGLHMDLYEDKGGELTVDEALDLAAQGRFQRSSTQEPGFGATASSWWVRLSLDNRGAQARELVLEQGYAIIDRLQLWELLDGQLRQRQTGDLFPFSERDIAASKLNFVLTIPARSRHTIFLRYSTSGALNIKLTLYEPIAYAENLGWEQMVQGLFYGSLLALALYNLFIFLIVRDFSYFLYIAYITSFGLFIAGFSGLSAQYLWPESPWWGNKSLLLFWGAAIATALAFSQNFLSLKAYTPRLNTLVNGFIVIALSCSLASFFLPYATVIKVLFLLAPPAYLSILVGGYYSIRRGFVPARYFMTAWGFLMLSAIVATLYSAGLIGENASVSSLILELGAFAEMVLLSIALASRIRELEEHSMTDALTRLFNRRFFDGQLSRSLAQARRHGTCFSLLVIDVDHFKKFNDSFGHAQGDRVLKAVAEVLKKGARRSDYVCRYGGEEFALILPDTAEDGAVCVAEELRSAIAESEMLGTPVTVSIGLASFNGEEGLDESELFKRADESLYRAKQLGRNRLEVFSGSLLSV